MRPKSEVIQGQRSRGPRPYVISSIQLYIKALIIIFIYTSHEHFEDISIFKKNFLYIVCINGNVTTKFSVQLIYINKNNKNFLNYLVYEAFLR
jgi:anaerobic C4-dicarboxylate transporter